MKNNSSSGNRLEKRESPFGMTVRKSPPVCIFVSLLKMITGFPGFIAKIYSVDFKTGYWQGLYQWRSMKDLEEYKQSFVLRMMKKRAKQGTLQTSALQGKDLLEYIEEKKIGCSADLYYEGRKHNYERQRSNSTMG